MPSLDHPPVVKQSIRRHQTQVKRNLQKKKRTPVSEEVICLCGTCRDVRMRKMICSANQPRARCTVIVCREAWVLERYVRIFSVRAQKMHGSDVLVPSVALMNAKETPLAATAAKSTVPWKWETSMPCGSARLCSGDAATPRARVKNRERRNMGDFVSACDQSPRNCSSFISPLLHSNEEDHAWNKSIWVFQLVRC